jgi:beta-phosphoglucomutase-like phosphatase (HAD superfamily)
VLAAKAARMVCVAVPEPLERTQPPFAIADAVLDSLSEVDDDLYDRMVAAREAPMVPRPSPTAPPPGG